MYHLKLNSFIVLKSNIRKILENSLGIFEREDESIWPLSPKLILGIVYTSESETMTVWLCIKNQLGNMFKKIPGPTSRNSSSGHTSY